MSYEILPYDETFLYSSKLLIIDVSLYLDNMKAFIQERMKDDYYRDLEVQLNISPEGMHMSFSEIHNNDCIMSMRINHVVALQMKQACEYYIKCYEEHRLQSDIPIYREKVNY